MLPGVGHPHFSAFVRVEVDLQVIAPPSCFPHIIGVATGVVQTSADFTRCMLLPVGNATVHPADWRKLDAGLPAFVDRWIKVFVTRRYLIGSCPCAYLESAAPVRIKTRKLPGGVYDTELRLFDQAISFRV